ncbi:S-layer homology domain-containing protein [Actinomarinicola tropica]|nr:S-layer homology domain-containing protein [Actinomarinicola tropica]
MRRTLMTAAMAMVLVATTTLPASGAEPPPDDVAPSAVTWQSARRSDALGDNSGGAGGLDIDEYQLSYDPTAGVLRVEARLLNAPPTGLWGLGIYVDLDRDRRTGCTGADRMVAVTVNSDVPVSQQTAAFPGGCGGSPDSMPLSATYLPAFGYLTLDVPMSLLGNPVSIDWALVASGAGGPFAGTDFAPAEDTFVGDFGWVRPFADVRTDAFYSGPIAWLRQTGLSTGVGSTGNYQPDGPVTRAQMATFVHRIAGEPPAAPSPFVDVQRPSFYAEAVDWFHQEGLTTGVGGTDRFAPNEPVTRGQLVTFLWRLAGEPDAYPAPGFADVTNTGAYYYRAVAWAKAEGVTTGVGGTNEFRPDDVVTRGQLATFLERMYAPLGTPTFVP